MEKHESFGVSLVSQEMEFGSFPTDQQLNVQLKEKTEVSLKQQTNTTIAPAT